MSEFPRIDPDHPLTEAARGVNAYAEEQGLPATLDWLGMKISPEELAYLCEQRALRAVAASLHAVNLGSTNSQEMEDVTRMIVTSPEWKNWRMVLMGCVMDGMTIGWRAAQIEDQDETN